MAKKDRFKNRDSKKPVLANSSQPTQGDYSIYYSDLSYKFPSKLKNPLWFAQALFNVKKNATRFLDPQKATRYRNWQKLVINESELRLLFDPKTPDSAGGQAEYMASDFKTNPLPVHLFNIAKADLLQKKYNMEVQCNDEYAMLRKQKDNQKIIYQREVRNLINYYLIQLGREPIKETQDPYKWAENFTKSKDGIDLTEKESKQILDTPQNPIDLIRSQIEDSEDMQMYNEMVYKGDFEAAFELGIKHYLYNENKFTENQGERVANDLMLFNKACCRKFTDETTGRPVIRYIDPESLYLLPIRHKTGEDLMAYYWEESVTFTDFVREMGRGLEPQQLVNVFNYYKTQNTFSNTYANSELHDVPYHVLNSSRIRIGFFNILTQDYDSFAAEYGEKNMPIDWKKFDWDTMNGEINQKDIMTKHYNVWYSCYYIPPTQLTISNADFQWQSNFIFKIEKHLDQARFGNDGRFTKPELVIYDNSEEASFMDMLERYRGKIDAAWTQFQNSLFSSIPNGGKLLAKEMLSTFLNATDNANKDSNDSSEKESQKALNATWKWFRQTGLAYASFTDPQTGALIANPQNFVVDTRINQMDECFKYLEVIGALYQQMTQALSISDLREGQDLKPRQSLGGAEQALTASKKGTWYIERAWDIINIQLAERMVQHISTISKEAKMGYPKRWEEFMNVIGCANAWALEGIADIPLQDIGMNVHNDEAAPVRREYWLSLANEMVKAGKMDEKFLFLMMKTENWKQAELLYLIGKKKAAKEASAQQEQLFQQQMQLKQMDLQIQQAMVGAKTQGKVAEIQTQGEVDSALQQQLNEIKAMTQSMLLEQRSQAKNNASILNTELEMQKERNRKDLEAQQSMLANV